MRINLFTLGDCTDPNTWSNLPYYFYQNLRAHSVDVRPIDLNPPENAVFKSFSRLMSLPARARRLVRPDFSHDVLRTRAHHAIVNRHVRWAARQRRRRP